MELEFAIRQTHVHELNKNDMKLELASYHESTNGQKVFYNLPTTAFTFHGMSLHSEAIVPVIREK